MSNDFILKASVQMEFIRENLNEIGLDIRESDGQTIYPWMNSAGYLDGAVFYIGQLGSEISDESKWTKITIPMGANVN